MTALEDMVLVPRPRHIEAMGAGPRAEGVPVGTAAGPDVAQEGFRLTITEADGVRIDHSDPAGLRYAQQLLDQIRSQASDDRLPALRVEDEPDIAVRGFMLDISRDRVPTKPTVERLVELMSLARLNQLQLSMEHTYAYLAHREVWSDASPMTPAHIGWLDELCARHGIELVPHQTTFGHMGRWLAHDSYRERAECPDGWELMPGVTVPPTVLAATPDNAAFVNDLLAELLPAFGSRQVHIGGDEPFELGFGASASAVAEKGLGRVYLDHLRRIVDPLLADGYAMQIWADVLRRHPEVAGDLPDGVTPIAWCYEAPPPDGRPVEIPDDLLPVLDRLGAGPDTFSGFAHNVAPLADAGIPFWVAPGTSSWNSLVGRIDNARANLIDAAEQARTNDASGYLITDWGDNGHHQPPSVSFGPLVYGGAVAWGLDANRDLDLAAVLDRHVFADPTGRVSTALDSLGHQWACTGQRAINSSPLAAALFPDQLHLVLGQADPDSVRAVVEEIDAALTLLAGVEPADREGQMTVAELTVAARMARHGAWRLVGDEGPTQAERANDMAEIVEGYSICWLDRARPGGLSDSLARLDPAALS